MAPGRPSSPAARRQSNSPAQGARRVVPSARYCCRFLRLSIPRCCDRQRTELAAGLAGVELRKRMQIPVINNVDVADRVGPRQDQGRADRQAYSPVRWVETIRKMAAMDITTVAECGPGKVLAGLSKRCADNLASVALADLAAMEAAVANLE
jgi:malonyl CoA-acyl carrier protein transacylase